MRFAEVPGEPIGKEIRRIGHHAADDEGNRLQESGAAQRQNRGRVRKGEWHNTIRVADEAGHPQVLLFRVGGGSHRPPPAASAVVLLAEHPGALAVFGPLNATLLTGANMSIGRRIGLLAINAGLAPLQ